MGLFVGFQPIHGVYPNGPSRAVSAHGSTHAQVYIFVNTSENMQYLVKTISLGYISGYVLIAIKYAFQITTA